MLGLDLGLAGVPPETHLGLGAETDDSTTTFYATAEDAGGVSSCSSNSITYVESSALPVDTDGDGIDDQTEIFVWGTDPNNPDTDGDGLLDSEVDFGLDPL
ncbi:hypothetical protein LCGC14_2541090, partial [marine sediment metagenome]